MRKGQSYAGYIAAHDSALESLAGRLRIIIGPVQARGFSRAGRINLASLFPVDQDFGMLNALVFSGDDRESHLWVATRSLVSAWIVQRKLGSARDLDAAFRRPEFYTAAIESDAAISAYASVAIPDARQLGVVQALLMRVGQDDSPLPPDELLVTVVHGPRVYIVTTPVAVTIPPPARCTAIRDSLQKEAMRNPAGRDDDSAELDYRKCYNERAPLDPAFTRIVAQVRAVAGALQY